MNIIWTFYIYFHQMKKYHVKRIEDKFHVKNKVQPLSRRLKIEGFALRSYEQMTQLLSHHASTSSTYIRFTSGENHRRI